MARIDLPDGDHEETVRLWLVNPTMGMAAGALSDAIYHKTTLPLRVRESARIRIAQINECPVCLAARTADDALTDPEYLGVAEWRSLDSLSVQEQLAAEFAERFALDHTNLDDDFWARLRAAFTDEEIVELATCIAGWLALGRITTIFGVEQSCALEL
jgi:alkylhydroperoxidase family enzyme